MEGFASKAAAVGLIVAGALTIATVAAGAASIKMAGDFQQGVNRLITGAGDTVDSFQMLSDGILKVSEMSGILSGPLVQAMYLIVSSGERGAQAFDTLAAAAKGAQIEQANVVDVANTLSGVITNYGTSVFTATDYMNGLIAAVAHGKITLQDLSTSMGPIDPIAKNLGISFADVAAAMTTQTNAMIPAARAATGLRFMMLALENPTTKAKDAMQALGLSSVDVANEMKVSLPGALQMIYDAAKKAGPEGSVPFDRAVADMIGGIRSLSTFTALTGTHLSEFEQNVRLISAAMHAGTGDVNGWAVAQSNFNVQLERAKAFAQAFMISVGQQLLPVLTKLIDYTITNIIPIFGGFSLAIHQIIDAFGLVTTPIDNTVAAAKPLLDTFDRASSYIRNATIQMKPLLDAFDRAPGVLRPFNDELTPLMDTFDRAPGILNTTTNAINPFYDAFKRLQPIIQDVSSWLGTVGDVARNTVIPAIANLAGKVGDIITDFFNWDERTHFVQNTLKDLGGFIATVAGYIANNLIPPIRSLISNFEEWLVNTNFVHNALQALGNIIGIVSAVAGTLIGWVAAIVGWFADWSPLAQAVTIVLVALGVAIAGIKFTEFVLGVIAAINALGGLAGILPALITRLLPNLTAAIGLFGTAVPTAVTQLTLFTTAEETAGVAAGGMMVSIASSIAVFAGWGAALVGATLAASALQTGLQGLVDKIFNVNPAVAHVTQGVGLLGPTFMQVASTADQTGTTVSDAMQQMEKSVVLSFANMNGSTTQQVAQMRTQVINELQVMQGLSAQDAAQMADKWIAEAQRMSTTATSAAQGMVQGILDQMDRLKNGSVQDAAQMRTGIMSELISTQHLSYQQATQLSTQWIGEMQKMSTASPQAMAQMRAKLIAELQQTLNISKADATNMADQWIAQMMTMKDQSDAQMAQMKADLTQKLMDTYKITKAQAEAMATAIISNLTKGKTDGLSQLDLLKSGSEGILKALSAIFQQQTQSWVDSVFNSTNNAKVGGTNNIGNMAGIIHSQLVGISNDFATQCQNWIDSVFHASQAIGNISFSPQINIPLPPNGRGGPYAMGGINIPPGTYLAGEKGPELITAAGRTNVYTAAQTASILAGGNRLQLGKELVSPPTSPIALSDRSTATSQQVIHVHLDVNGREIANIVVDNLTPAATDKLGAAIIRATRSRTGIKF